MFERQSDIQVRLLQYIDYFDLLCVYSGMRDESENDGYFENMMLCVMFLHISIVTLAKDQKISARLWLYFIQ